MEYQKYFDDNTIELLQRKLDDPDWISIKDELPKAPMMCWIKSDIEKKVTVGLYDPIGKLASWKLMPLWYTVSIVTVTHWKPVEKSINE